MRKPMGPAYLQKSVGASMLNWESTGYTGGWTYPTIPGMNAERDGGALTHNEPSGHARAGGWSYPTLPGMNAERDNGALTHNLPESFERGSLITPYNVVARGLGTRGDKLRKKIWTA